MSLPVSPPYVLRAIAPQITWRIPSPTNTIYLTFDDGPIPEVTEFVLNLLKAESIQATFFCIGNNVRKNPDIFERIVNEGHGFGNHTHNHLNGWVTSRKAYYRDILEASELIHSSLFRPPYGKISIPQAKSVLQRYKIIMWDVLSYDFDKNTSIQKCTHNVIANTRSGSIIVFHDSIKAFKNLEGSLPVVIKELKSRGFNFGIIPGIS